MGRLVRTGIPYIEDFMNEDKVKELEELAAKLAEQISALEEQFERISNKIISLKRVVSFSEKQ